MQAIFRTDWCLSLFIYPIGRFDTHLLCPSLLGEMIQFDYTIHFCTIFSYGWFKHLATRFGDWSSTMWSCRGGNAELAAAVPGLEVVAGHKDAVTWWCSFGDWITSTGLVVNSVHVRAFFGFQTGPQTTTKPMISIFLGQKELFILSVRILVSTCGTVCT